LAPKISEFSSCSSALTVDENVFACEFGKTSFDCQNAKRPLNWSCKKFQEVLPLVAFIEQNKSDRNFDTIIDIGSGLVRKINL